MPEVTIERDGQQYTGTYEVRDGMVYVYYNNEERRTHKGGSPIHWVTERLLGYIVDGVPNLLG